MAGPLERVKTGKSSYVKLNAKDAAAYRAAHPELRAEAPMAPEAEAAPASRGRRGASAGDVHPEAASTGRGAE